MDTRLVGRQALLAELDAAVHAAAQGSGGVVLLTGEAGIGKTSVARAVATAARDVLAVSWGRCGVDPGAPPFWPWEALIGSEAVSAKERPTEPAIGAERFEQLSQLRAAIVARAQQQPLLHVLEDLQWADIASVMLLNHLGATLDDVPMLIVATLRTGDELPAALSEALTETQRLVRVSPLAPFDEREIGELLADRIDTPASLVLARTGGNPLFVTELLRAGSPSDPLRDVPSRIAELVTDRLRRLPDAVADALVTAAVIGSEGDTVTLAAVADIAVEDALELMAEAEKARLVEDASGGRWRFRHALVRDAIYASASAGVRARRHAAVVGVLAGGAAAEATLAHHALAALPLFDAEHAVALAAAAGDAAMAQHAYEDAVGWFERALAAAPAGADDHWRAELLVQCGDAHRQSGAIEPARRAYLEATERTDDPELFARAALGYADPGVDLGIAYRSDDPISGVLLERAIDKQAPFGDSETLALLETRRAATLYFSDEPERARPMADAALERATRIGASHATIQATALIHDAFVVGRAQFDEQLAGSERLLELARASGSPAALLTAHRARVFDLLAAGDIPAMDAEITAFRRIAEPWRVPIYDWWPALWSAMRALLEGRHDEAESRAIAAFQLGETAFPTLPFLNLSFFLFFLRREQGRLEEMEQMTRDMVASRADIPALRIGLLFLLAELGHHDEVVGLLGTIDDSELTRLRDRNWPVTWFQLARTAFLVGDARVATLLLRDEHRPTEPCIQVSVGTVCLGAADLGTAWLHHTLGDVARASEAYDAAEAMNARIGARSWLTQTRADRATLAPVPAVDGDATFARDNGVWDLQFGDRGARIPHARGMNDLAYLLANPHQAVSVLELADAPEPSTRGAEALDERARREIRQRLQELDDAEADAEAAGDGERAALAREQRQLLAEAVARDFGLGGKARRVDDPIERARKTVSIRIRRTIAAIGKVHPELGRHLARSVDTGTWCAYRPAEDISWKT